MAVIKLRGQTVQISDYDLKQIFAKARRGFRHNIESYDWRGNVPADLNKRRDEWEHLIGECLKI